MLGNLARPSRFIDTLWRDRQFLRLSVQGYNTQRDMSVLADALAHILPEVTV